MRHYIRINPPLRFHRFCLIPLLSLLSTTVLADDTPHGKIIAGFGSSVCDGYGDHLKSGGYIGRLETLLADQGWQVVDVSRGGDNTILIQERWEATASPPSKPVDPGRYLLPHKPKYVLIGLSLGNEGIKTNDANRRAEVLDQFRNGMLGIIERCRDEGIRPVVVNCYASTAFEPEEYDATKRMNVLINGWDVPSVNMLGTIDDGHGRWASGFLHDDWHPSGGGYEEMFLAIVPTLFDAMEAGKPIPVFSEQSGYAHVMSADAPALRFEPEHTVHAFSQAFWFRCAGDGKLASIAGHTGRLQITNEEFGATSRVVSSNQPFSSTISIDHGSLVYTGADGQIIRSKALVNDGQWHLVVLSHRAAKGQTLMFRDGHQVGIISERLIPETFGLGGSAEADLRDWLMYRSSLNDYDVAALQERKMIQSSLEIYAPLRDELFKLGEVVENRAQSLSQAQVVSDTIRTHQTEMVPTHP